MRQNISLSLLLLCITLSYCKKEAKSSSPDPSAPTSPTTQGVDAEIYAFKEVYLDNAGWPVHNVHAAIFYASTVTSSSVASVNAGTVSINGTNLKIDAGSTGPFYIDSTDAIASSNYLMNISGSAQFPAGILQYGQSYPAFNDTSSIPSTVQLSSGISLQFNNCTTSDSVAFTIQDNNGVTVHKKYLVVNNQVHLTMSAAELSILSPTTNGIIMVDISRITYTMVGAKRYQVTLEKRYNKLNVQLN